MTFTRSLREIPLDEEPHASVLEALTPDTEESPYTGEPDFSSATEEQLRHLSMCPDCRLVLTGSEDRILFVEEDVEGPSVAGIVDTMTGLPTMPPGYVRTESGLFVADDGVVVYDESGAVGAVGITASKVKKLRAATKKEHNKLRAKWGKPAVKGSSVLNGYAQSWANTMARRNVMAHSPVSHRVKARDAMRARSIGENVAVGYDTPATVVNVGWRRSCAHFYNMLNKSHKRIGVGVARRNGRTYWCVLFTGSAGACSSSKGGVNGFCCKCVGSSCTSWKSTDKNRP